MNKEEHRTTNNKEDSNKESHSEEYQYLNIIQKIIDTGSWEIGRNGRVKSIFGEMMRFSLADGKIPILTTKKTAWKTCLKELLWFVRGETDNALLQEQGVHIWDGNTSREFLDSRGLHHYREGLIGPGYGFQWRHFGGDYDADTNTSRINRGVDQLQQIIDVLKDPTQRTSRRLIMTAWNPSQLDQMALPPCHMMCQFNVHDGNKLSCAMTQRSCDELLGVPFNIASYSFLTHLLAHHCGLEAHEFVYFKGNCHLYEDHIDAAKTQLERTPFEFPTLQMGPKRDSINDYVVDDFRLSNYRCHEAIKAKMVV
jgi:thymidylate synthase